MIAEKIKFFQGYVRVRLTGYAPERFLNLTSSRNILIWDLQYREEHYEFCISIRGFRQLKPLLKKTKTRLLILEKHGFPFWLHRYRKRKLFAAGVTLCLILLFVMSRFIWSIEIEGNGHRTDDVILKYLESVDVYHGIAKSRLDCSEIEELLRSGFDDIIWASAKIQGTRLIISIQENLIANQNLEKPSDLGPSDLVADKEAEIYSILTRQGTPCVEKGSVVKPGDLLVEGRLPIVGDSGEIVSYQYCSTDADILGITLHSYEDSFSLEYEDKIRTGNTHNSYRLMAFQKQLKLPGRTHGFARYDTVVEEHPLKLGENFYLPFVWCKEQAFEYRIQRKTYTEEEARQLAEEKLQKFCKKLKQKGVQILENHVIIVVEGEVCRAAGDLKVIEPIGTRQATEITEVQQEGQHTDESDRDND
ncbi:MAG: sporulation protein YqfD [Lachnospiraceae bacterium]|nr:sporulation protein YqfD [Lachnospiraceae bacterium]